MLKRSSVQIDRLMVILAFFCSLSFAGTPWGGSAGATLLTAANGFLTHAEPAQGEGHEAAAVSPSGSVDTEKERRRSVFRLYAGGSYRTDEFNWNIAGNLDGTDPNILSELTWEDLNIYELSLGFTSLVKQIVYLKGYMNYGSITSGICMDSDYSEDDRQGEFSRSDNSADGGYTIDVSLGAGVMLPAIAEFIRIMPMVGLSYHRQNLTMTDGYQTIPQTGAFPGLDSTYTAQWRGPWVGLEMQADIETGWRSVPKLLPFVGVEYHWALYDAEADWNLREEFAHPRSFEHEAQGNGVRFMMGLGAFLSERWSLEVGYTQQKWSAEDGTDRVFFSDGTYSETRLNEVNWDSRALGLFVRFQF